MHRYETGLRDSYKEQYLKLSNKPVELKEYLEITKEYNKMLIDELQDKGLVHLPERLGTLSIVGTKAKMTVEDGKIKGLAPDWKATKELWESDKECRDNKQLVYHFNEETNGIRYRYLWSTKNVALINRTIYNLIMTKGNKRDLAKLIKSGKEYLIIKK